MASLRAPALLCLATLSMLAVAHATVTPQPSMYEITRRRLAEEGWKPSAEYLETMSRQANKPLPGNRGRELDSKGWRMGATVPSLSSGPSMSDINITHFRWDSVVAPAVIDWRTTPRITPIFNQYTCAACWAIAATDAVSMMWAIISNSTPTVASPQQVCDCGTKSCCSGGWPEYAFTFMIMNSGITSDSAYNYYANDSSVCSVPTSSPVVAQITGWEQVPAYDAISLMKAVATQPVIVFIDASAGDFQMYPSYGKVNIYNGNCTNDINHAAVVVGYNLTGSYWILKNSWAMTWADKGYGYINMVDGPGKCGMLSVPPLYPVYYPNGPQPVAFGSDGNEDDDNSGSSSSSTTTTTTTSLFSLSSTSTSTSTYTYSKKGKYKVKFNGGSDGNPWTGWSGGYDACTGFINPCGSGTCWTQNGYARCTCTAGYVEVLGSPTSKCVSATPCSKTANNPCGSGACNNTGDGTYTCACNDGFAVGSLPTGLPTCVAGLAAGGGGRTYTSTFGDTCSGIQSMFGISNTTLLSFNPFVNCSVLIPPGLILIVSNSTASGCASSYSVKAGDSCSSITNDLKLQSNVLQTLNPSINCNRLYQSRQLCVKSANFTSTAAATAKSLVCGQAYTTVAGDTCTSIQGTFSINNTWLTTLNPGLNCNSKSLPVGWQICVKNASVAAAPPTCTQYYQVVQGDSCPTIWNAANLTMAQFFLINPGIRCQAPYLQVGQLVCVASPSAAVMSNVVNRQYITSNGDTFYTISTIFSFQCNAVTVSPGNLAAVNGFALSTKFPAGVVLAVPCSPKPGLIDCGCTASISTCGSDSVSYNSYCQSLCNYGSPSVSVPCTSSSGTLSGQSGLLPVTYCAQSSYCYGRPGMAPTAGGPSGCTCPYAQWPISSSDSTQIMGSNSTCAMCRYANSTCNNMCMQCKQARTCVFNTCWGNCMSCSRIPCGGPQAVYGGVTYACVTGSITGCI